MPLFSDSNRDSAWVPVGVDLVAGAPDPVYPEPTIGRLPRGRLESAAKFDGQNRCCLADAAAELLASHAVGRSVRAGTHQPLDVSAGPLAKRCSGG
jgi:hypothetical protein